MSKNKNIIDSFFLLFKKISEVSIPILGLIILIMTVFIGVEVLIRKFFSLSLTGVEEYSGYSMAIMAIWGCSYTLIQKGHIRIDFFYRTIPNALRRFLDILSLIAMIIFVSPLTYFGYRVFQRSFSRLSKANTSLATPLWIPQIVWFLGIVLLLVVLVIMLIKLSSHLLKKEWAEAKKLYGLEDDLQEEIDIKQ